MANIHFLLYSEIQFSLLQGIESCISLMFLIAKNDIFIVFFPIYLIFQWYYCFCLLIYQLFCTSSISSMEEAATDQSSNNDAYMAPHVLTMSATPIPRTLALALYGDMSLTQVLSFSCPLFLCYTPHFWMHLFGHEYVWIYSMCMINIIPFCTKI